MAKPIEAIPPFKGKAAKALTEYLKTRRPNAAKQQRAREHLQAAKRVKPLRQ